MDRNPWEDGRQAWERLGSWYQGGASAAPGHPDDGDAALSALADVGAVRRLLDQAELAAVRTARRHSRSWAEIATLLGVTRQSAWERWRDLDEVGSARPSGGDQRDEVAVKVERAAREWRGRSSTVVPNVIGMSWDDARAALGKEGLVAVGADPDGPPLTAADRPDGMVVTDQSPESGAKVPAGSPVRLWVSRGGGSAGVREPRRPTPAPKSAREVRYEPSDSAVG
jgi:PASTA domain